MAVSTAPRAIAELRRADSGLAASRKPGRQRGLEHGTLSKIYESIRRALAHDDELDGQHLDAQAIELVFAHGFSANQPRHRSARRRPFHLEVDDAANWVAPRADSRQRCHAVEQGTQVGFGAVYEMPLRLASMKPMPGVSGVKLASSIRPPGATSATSSGCSRYMKSSSTASLRNRAHRYAGARQLSKRATCPRPLALLA